MSRMRINEQDIPDADVFKILLDSFPDMIHSVDDDGTIVFTNQTATKMLGYSRQELLGMNIRQIYADEVLDELDKGFKDLKKRGDKRVESILKTKDGTRIPVEIRSFSIYDDEGLFLRTFSILRDIREIKQLQNSLVHAGRLAAIGELASGVAHDINNPLTVILLSIEMIAKELQSSRANPPDTSRLLAFTHNCKKASGSIQKLADHLRTFSRGMAEQHETVDLFEVINDAVFITGSRINEHGIDLRFSAAKGRYYVLGCPNQLEQVFVNLIGNACDAMAGLPERILTISINSDERNGQQQWRIDLCDTGSGVPETLRDDIFQSFYTTKPKGKGTGLGLSISRGITRDHKGELELHSSNEKGSTFRVYLPQATPPA